MCDQTGLWLLKNKINEYFVHLTNNALCFSGLNPPGGQNLLIKRLWKSLDRVWRPHFIIFNTFFFTLFPPGKHVNGSCVDTCIHYPDIDTFIASPFYAFMLFGIHWNQRLSWELACQLKIIQYEYRSRGHQAGWLLPFHVGGKKKKATCGNLSTARLCF